MTMVVEPWLPGDAVKYAYTTIQRRYLGRQRQPGSDNLAVFEFVVDRMNDKGEIDDWDAVMAEWNSNHPKQKYVKWMFVRAFERARELIIFFGRDATPQPRNEVISL